MSKFYRAVSAGVAFALPVLGMLVLTPEPVQARDGGRGCYCSGYECGDHSQFMRWCCTSWPTGGCGCTLFIVNCIDNQE